MNTTNQDETMIEKLFSYIGVIENVPESLMNAIGGLSGSGPAYVGIINIIYFFLKQTLKLNKISLGISCYRSISRWCCEDGCSKTNGNKICSSSISWSW